MIDRILYTAGLTLCFVVLLSLAAPLAQERHRRWLIAAVAFVFLNTSLLAILPRVPGVPRIGDWNWVGKSAAVMATLVWFYASTLRRSEAGLVWPPWRPTIIGVAGAAILSGSIRVFFQHEPQTLEDFLFQLTAPSLDEELAFRGLLFAMLCRSFSAGMSDRRGMLLSAAVVTVLFVLGHVVTTSRAGVSVSPQNLFVFIPGSLFMYLRVRTGSILASGLAHSAWNVTNGFVATLI